MPGVLLALAMCLPAQAVTVFGDPADYVAGPGTSAFGVNLDGVVRITSDVLCSGALLADGIHVLTAAHCVDAGGTITVGFDTSGGPAYDITVSSVTLAPGWSGLIGQELTGEDLALLTLSTPAIGVTGYNLYTGNSEVGSAIVIAGWGEQGTGASGAVGGTFGTRRYGLNRYDATAAGFSGGTSNVVMGDFDNGMAANDAFGSLSGSLSNLGLGTLEVSISPGDSGGPSFLGGLLVGIHSFGGRVIGSPPDINGQLDYSFGELFGDTRISSSSWLEAQLVPEPDTFVLAFLGLAALGGFSRARARR